MNAKRYCSDLILQPSVNPHDLNDRSRHLLAAFSEYLLASTSRESPPSIHTTEDDVETFVTVERLDVDSIMPYRFVRRFGRRIAVLYETQWIGSMNTSSKREVNSRRFRSSISPY